jgi:hypothetical protein
MAMAHRPTGGTIPADHGDDERVYSAVLAHLHPQLPKHRAKKRSKPLAASLFDLGIDLRRLAIGRYTFSCRLCQQQHRTAPMQIEITAISTRWSCRSCGEMGAFSIPRRQRSFLQVAP